MNPAQKHPHSQHLRDRSEQLIQALDALPAPKSLADILRHARALMTLDRLLTQLWKAPTTRAAKAEAAEADDAATPLNRQQRRAQAARDRAIKPPPTEWREAG